MLRGQTVRLGQAKTRASDDAGTESDEWAGWEHKKSCFVVIPALFFKVRQGGWRLYGQSCAGETQTNDERHSPGDCWPVKTVSLVRREAVVVKGLTKVKMEE